MAESTIKILLIDDDYVLRKGCENLLADAGYEVLSCRNPEEGMRLLRENDFDIAVTDYQMPVMNGIEFMRVLQRLSPQTDVIMITAYATIEMAVEAMRLGAFDYLQKPFQPDQLLETVRRVVQKRQVGKSGDHELKFDFDGKTMRIIGKSKAMQQIFQISHKVAPTNSTVLITGESGTGKEMIARAIHAFSHRKDKPFFAMDCGSLVETLFESELFGHVKGSFTGASETKHGTLELADQGTFFFDEIGNISLNVQAKILRAIQEKEIRRVGGTDTIRIDVRIIAATNQNIEEAIQNGQFREDLYYRLSVIPIHLPALRERPEDIPLLIDHFVSRYNQKRQKKPIKNVSEAAMNALLTYSWPGNVRELQNVIERAAVIEEGTTLTIKGLPEHMVQKEEKPSHTMISMAEMEKLHIANVLDSTNRNISQSAKILKIDRKTLYDKIRKYKL
jgi:DNA-binding NtrC family response regulator